MVLLFMQRAKAKPLVPDLLESDTERYFVSTSLDNRVWPIKIWPFGVKGFPDRLCLCEGGMVFFVELKRPRNGRLSRWQVRIHTRLRSLGFNVYTIYDKQGVDAFYS